MYGEANFHSSPIESNERENAKLKAKAIFLEKKEIVKKTLIEITNSKESTLDYFNSSNDFTEKIAIIESLSELGINSEQQIAEQCRKTLEEIAESEDYCDIEGGYNTGIQSLSDYHYHRECSTGFEIIQGAALINLEKFGKDAEQNFINIIGKNIDDLKKINWKEAKNNFYSAHSVDFDQRKYVTTYDYVDRMEMDENYYVNNFCLSVLEKIGSERTIDFFVDLLLKNERFAFIYGPDFLRILETQKEHSIGRVIQKITNEKLSGLQGYRAMSILTRLEKVEIFREIINEKINIIKNNRQKNNLEYAYSLITPNDDKEAIRKLQDFYQEKIKFEDYKVNQEMNEGEVSLLKSLIRKDEKVLEEGCGTGRLFLEMKKAGYDITGFDFTPRHVDEIKKQDPEANASEDNWHKTKFADESFDAVYSLGRNILHDYSIIDQAQLFREANRILKLGGKFIFDIPNRDKGGYKEMVDEYGNEMKKRGIKNFRQGTIYDSPDGINFATRYAYSKEDIKMLAQMTGFEISLVKKEPLKTGKGDENIYYVLEKKS